MWMAETTQVVDLSSYLLIHVRFLGQFVLVDDLDSDRHSSSQMITLYREKSDKSHTLEVRNGSVPFESFRSMQIRDCRVG